MSATAVLTLVQTALLLDAEGRDTNSIDPAYFYVTGANDAGGLVLIPTSISVQ